MTRLYTRRYIILYTLYVYFVLHYTSWTNSLFHYLIVYAPDEGSFLTIFFFVIGSSDEDAAAAGCALAVLFT
jgi:hypothetical protein